MCLNNSIAMQDRLTRNNTLQHEQLELNYNVNDSCDYVDNIDHLATEPTDLSLIQWNTRGLMGKLATIHDLLRLKDNQRQIDICLLSETWLTDQSQSMVDIPGYQLICKNRENRKGGGVGVLVSKHLKVRERTDLTDATISTENCFVEVMSKNGNIIVGSLYRPPNTDELVFLEFIKRILAASKSEKKELILGMDHNLNLLQSHRHHNTEKFLDLVLKYTCLPTISKPSRITKNSATLIDNIFISRGLQNDYDSGLIVNDASDHLPCYLRVAGVMPGLREPVKIEFRKINDSAISGIKTELDRINWSCLNDLSTDNSFNYFHDVITSSLDKHAPSQSLKRSIKKQQTLYRKTLKSSCSDIDRTKYLNYRKILTKLKRSCKKDYYSKKCLDFKSDSKKLWRLINKAMKKTSDKTSIIDCIKTNKIMEYRGSVIRETFAEYFANVGKNFANSIPNSKKSIDSYIEKIIPCHNSMFMNPTHELEIKDILSKLPSKTSSGFDAISNKL